MATPSDAIASVAPVSRHGSATHEVLYSGAHRAPPYPPPPRSRPETTHARLTQRGRGAYSSFPEISATFPLKLLAPRVSDPVAARRRLGVVYLVSYGGGLVSGDRVRLDVDVGPGCVLLLLTQGSTKVFKARLWPRQTEPSALQNGRGRAATSVVGEDCSAVVGSTTQTFHTLVREGGSLVLLPSPVTCFASSSYVQTQTFDLECRLTCSLVLLDWFTSGRMRRGEEWMFRRYASRNVVRVQGRPIVRDVTVLEDDDNLSDLARPPSSSTSASPLPPRQGSYAARLQPYACYATLILVGPLCASLVTSLREESDSIVQRARPEPDDLVWSFSDLLGQEDEKAWRRTEAVGKSAPEGSQGRSAGLTGADAAEDKTQAAIVRVAARETEMVRDWLAERLSGLRDVVGNDLFARAFA